MLQTTVNDINDLVSVAIVTVYYLQSIRATAVCQGYMIAHIVYDIADICQVPVIAGLLVL